MGKCLGIDFGLKRTGISISDKSNKIAFPLKTIKSDTIINEIQDIKKGDGTMKMNGNGNGGTPAGPPPPTAQEIEQIVAKASAGGPVQTIRIEQAPLKITTDEKPYQ